MNIVDLKDSLPYLFQAGVTPFIWGHSGLGKTTVIRQYAKNKGYHFFPLYLGTQSDLGDVLGLADFVRDENGTAIATTFATPIWLKNAIDFCNENPDSGAIIFLDEFNRARRDVLQGMFSLALDKTFHTIKLPTNCYIVAAGNPPTEEYQTTDVDDTALMARFAHIKLEPTVQEWIQYAKENNYSSDLISFIQEQPLLLEDHKSDFNLPVKVDRRAYERMQKLFNVNTPNNLVMQLMQGILGLERTVAYQKHIESAEKPLTGEEILNNTWLTKLNNWISASDIKASFITSSTDNLRDSLIKRADQLLTDNEKESLMTYLNTIPKEIMYVFTKENMSKENPCFSDFIANKEYQSKLANLVLEARGKQPKKAS